MRILAAAQGEYGKRIAENIANRAPEDWTIETVSLPKALPVLIDEPEEFLPSEILSADLLLALIESDGAAQLVPALAKLSGAKSVIVPVDSPSWLPPGLQSQIDQELSRDGVTGVFPRSFCTLTENSTGYQFKTVSYDDETISAFAGCFGRPSLKLTLDSEGETIMAVTVKRGSPCGSTQYAAEKLIGMAVSEALISAGLIVHHFPCLASMEPEEIDDGVFEPFMSISGYVMNEEIEKELGPAG